MSKMSFCIDLKITDKSGVLWACLFLDPTASSKTKWELQAGEE